MREIKQLEGTRGKVIANAAMRAKIQDTLGQKEAIQDQVKVSSHAPIFSVCFLLNLSIFKVFYIISKSASFNNF